MDQHIDFITFSRKICNNKIFKSISFWMPFFFICIQYACFNSVVGFNLCYIFGQKLILKYYCYFERLSTWATRKILSILFFCKKFRKLNSKLRKLKLIQTECNYRRYSFLPRTVFEWNSLPTSVVTVNSPMQFRTSIVKNRVYPICDTHGADF